MSVGDTATRLIHVFAARAADEVGEEHILPAFGLARYAEVEEIADFAQTFNRIDTAKRKLEWIASRFVDAEAQALQCLGLLHAERGTFRDPPPAFEEVDRLVLEALYPRWGALQPEYQRRRALLCTWFDVFVSYTNRDAVSTNQSYAEIIRKEWGRKVDPADTRTNYVAATLAKFLQQNNLRSFYDYDSLECGDDIEDEVLTHSSATIGFVQLVEPETFREPRAPHRNWSKEEFDAFHGTTPPRAEHAEPHRRQFFVLARGDTVDAILPRVRPPTYEPWIDDVSRHLHLTLDTYRADPDGLRVALGALADSIVDAKEKLIDAMLAAW